MKNVSKTRNGKSKIRRLEITVKQFAEHRRRFPVRNSFAAAILTDALEMKLWNKFLNSDDPSIVQEALGLAKAYGMRVTQKGSGT